MKLPKKCVVDTNVPVRANMARDPGKIPDELVDCVMACVEAIHDVIAGKRLVLDDDGMIFREYIDNLSLSGQPGVGDYFAKWVYNNRYSLPQADLVRITPKDDTFEEFPVSPELDGFDRSDRKFIAVANAHASKPPILQATDSKWWGYRTALENAGITVVFLCEKYIAAKHHQKIGKYLRGSIRKNAEK